MPKRKAAAVVTTPTPRSPIATAEAANVLMSLSSEPSPSIQDGPELLSPGGFQLPYSTEEKVEIVKEITTQTFKKGGKGKSDAAINKAAASALNASGAVPSRVVSLRVVIPIALVDTFENH
jgi:Mrp family chromosome partitioning ATPase